MLGGALTATHATARARLAAQAAEAYTHQVHAATRVFVDWLIPSAVNRQLDAMALRRMHLLEEARFERIRATALLFTLLGAIGLILIYAARTLRSGIDEAHDPDAALLPPWVPGLDDDSRPARRARRLPYQEARAASLKSL